MYGKGWSTRESDWDFFRSEELSRAAWQEVRFTSASASFVPQKRGVYMLVFRVKGTIQSPPFSEFSAPLYVGHSTKLKQRFKQHSNTNRGDNIRGKISYGKLQQGLVFCYAVYPEYSVDQLKRLEQGLISAFGPPLNSINAMSRGMIKESPVQATLSKGVGNA